MAQFHHIANANILANDVLEVENDEGQENNARGRRAFHERDDAFQLTDDQFVKLFRLTKQLTRNVIALVEEHTAPPSRTSALDAKLKVLTALRFFASGSYQMDIGCNVNMNLSQASVSRCIKDVVEILNREDVCNIWINFPNTFNDMQDIRNRFYREYGFLGVVGCIDCTHIAIVPPKKDDPQYPEHIFVNRKGYHSLNVQLICDSNLKITHCNARYPGSTHDNFIWNNCNVLPLMRRISEDHGGYYLLGDSGYGLRSWLLTPILNAEPATPQDRYNICHKRTRATIERCNGVLKMRFRCLLKHRVLHYSPDVAAKIVKACVVLHNMCIANNIHFDDDAGIDEGNIDLEVDVAVVADNNDRGRVDPELANGRRLQEQLIRRHFT